MNTYYIAYVDNREIYSGYNQTYCKNAALYCSGNFKTMHTIKDGIIIRVTLLTEIKKGQLDVKPKA